jgi:oligoendopeptidase F
MFSNLPDSALEFMDWNWSQIKPYYQDLTDRPLDTANVADWLADWSRLGELLGETFNRLYIATSLDTTDQVAEKRYQAFLDDIYPQMKAADQQLKEKLLSSKLEPVGFEIPLRDMRAEVDIFQENNLPLLTQELKLGNEYDKIIGAQTVTWEGEEITLMQLKPVYQDTNREKRERAWRMASNRQLADREAINELWAKFMDLRQKIGRNAGLSDYRAYRWKQMLRFDYTPEDCAQFHHTIERVAVPAAERILEKRRHRLGLESLRPWDLEVDPYGLTPLRPFKDVDELVNQTAIIFHQVDPQLGVYFKTMQSEGLLDLDNRKGKAPGGYCEELQVIRRPFIFMNAVGLDDDVQTLLHEGGHAFHVFETANLPYIQQRQVGLEFAEVASMSMELLAAPYLDKGAGGFYSPADAARSRIESLEKAVLFWPYMAVVDAFQHWVYKNHALASDASNCDVKWAELWVRFMPGVDWTDLEQEMMTGWHRILHIHVAPLYYIEYGLAQLGAFQVWQNAAEDQAGAVDAYRQALSLGSTLPLPQLFAAAGANFAFDEENLQQAVNQADTTIAELETIAGY